MSKPKFLLDIDGCVFNWDKGLIDFIDSILPHKSKNVDETCYDLQSRFGISRDEAESIICEFHYDDSFSMLEPLNGVVDAISILSSKYDLVAITACGNDPIIHSLREKNLKDCFGNAFSELYCTDTSFEKKEYLARFDPTHWVEDHERNAEFGLEFGHKCWLISAPYNKTKILDKRVTRVDSLLDICYIEMI